MRSPTSRKSCRLTAVLAIALLTAGVAVLTTGPASAAGPHCTPPYVQVQDAAPPPANDPANTFAIQRINMGEPFVSCTQKALTVIMKVPQMAQTPPDGIWRVLFKIPATANSQGQERTLFLEYNSTLRPNGLFDYGWVDPVTMGTCAQCALDLPTAVCPATGTVAADGTITMTLNLTSTVSFGTCAQSGGSTMTITPAQWTAGKQITEIQGVTQVVLQPLLTGGISDSTYIDQATTAGDGTYTLQGTVSCSNAPVAALTAAPTSGDAPLTVNFNASTSSNTGGCGTINSYIFDFGDGQQVSQSTPTVSHTYTTGGATYPARVRVTNSAGLTSSNIAQQNITVNSAGPPLVSSIVSRKTHTGVGDFDIVLPQPPAARSVECRSGDYKMVFTFLNNVTSVGSVSVTGGSAALLGSASGPLSNQYTVDLSVPSGTTATVTLNNALDSNGASGNVTGLLGVLVGDTTGNGSVNSSDISQTKSQSGQAVSASNFRQDVTVNGSVNSSDISLVKSRSGTALP